MNLNITAYCAVLLTMTAGISPASAAQQDAGGNVASRPDTSNLSDNPPTYAPQAVTLAAGGEIQDSQDPATATETLVTGPRIDRAGYTARTPTVVVSFKALEDRAAVNTADVLNESSSFQRTSDPESRGIATPGANNVDLRSLGSVSSLVLLNRMRLPAVRLLGSTVAGVTNLNLIHVAPIDRRDLRRNGRPPKMASRFDTQQLRIAL